MSESWLTTAEVIELTAKTRWKAQCRALDGLQVPYAVNAAGRPLVERRAGRLRYAPPPEVGLEPTTP